ncbi:MAG: DUF4249 family protein [Cryomorphaceae bacterium]|nr:DUF4249 family protein [Cryomorphaceae bacterium]
MRHLLYIALVLALVSCEKEIPFDGDLSAQKVVLNCYIGAGELAVYAEVSRTETVLSDEPLTFVSNAVVQLFDGSTLIGTFTSLGEGRYVLNYTPEAGKTYNIKCADPLLGEVQAETTVPNNVALEVVNVEIADDLEGKIDIDIRFEDGASEDDFYHLLLYTDFGGQPNLLSFETQEEFLRNTDELSENSFFYFDDCLFDDNSFTSQSVDIRFTAFALLETDNRIQLVHVSSDYFNYRKSLKLATDASGNPFSQPVQIYSNIQGGLGIFAGYAADEQLME